MKKKFKIGLLLQIVIAIALGIGAGYVMPVWAARIFATFNVIFSQFLQFLVPLIIVGFVTPAIADIGNKAGKVLVATALIAYIATFCSGLLSYFTGILTFPGLLPSSALNAGLESGHDILPYFSIEIPPMFVVMTALVLAFMLGIGIAYSHGTILRNGAAEFRDIVAMTIRVAIIPLLPVYIFCTCWLN